MLDVRVACELTSKSHARVAKCDLRDASCVRVARKALRDTAACHGRRPVRDLRPQGREPWCTCSRGSAPLSRATSLEAARLYLKLSPTRVESLHVPTSRASRATRPSPRLSIRDGPAPRRLRWTALHRGVRSVWPRSPAPLGRGACKQAGGLSCPKMLSCSSPFYQSITFLHTYSSGECFFLALALP